MHRVYFEEMGGREGEVMPGDVNAMEKSYRGDCSAENEW